MRFVSKGQRYYREADEPLKINVDLVLVDIHPGEIDNIADAMASLEQIFGGEFELLESNANQPPMRYWQHDETGRVCANVFQPSERWNEITRGLYRAITMTAIE